MTLPDHYARAKPDQYAPGRSVKDNASLTLGGPAFYTDDGRRERVVICSEPFDYLDEDGVTRSYRTVAFVDEDGHEYDVQARTLEPADDATWLIAGCKGRERVLIGSPPLGPYPSVRPQVIAEPKRDPLHGVEVRSLSDDQRRRLEEVDRLLGEAAALAKEAEANQFGSAARRARTGEGERQSARRILLELQAEIAARAANDGTERYLTELSVLEKGRGGRLDITEERGGSKRARIRSRGGLQYAWERGDLDGGKVRGDLLYEVGKRYRDAYERATGLTTPTGQGTKSTEGRQLGVAVAIEDLATMRLGMSPKRLAVVNRVCGLDMTVRATATQLKAGVPSVKRALRAGLTLAAENKLWV